VKYLITGTAGFIGYHLAQTLLAQGHQVVGIDGMTTYYDINLKEERNRRLTAHPGFSWHELMLEDGEQLDRVVAQTAADRVVHLAAQAGVRYSLENPGAYIQSNIVGTFNLLQACRAHPVGHLVMASTSSVYGANKKVPFSELDRADHPMSLYAATKKATEDLAHSYSHLFGIPLTMFRFFTVYGPWGRPDMALFKFVKAALEGKPIDVYNHGKMQRDFTYVSDLVDSIVKLCESIPQRGKPVCEADTLSPAAAMRVVNIGGGNPVPLLTFIDEIEGALGMPIARNYMEMQAGDVETTEASGTLLRALTGERQWTPVSVGVRSFVSWYREHYQV
jgi:UDP-glucuronate 4-epimerase